jgi:hypothetical protein
MTLRRHEKARHNDMSRDIAIRDLIEQLEDIAQEYDDNVIVRMAQQPSWPFEYSITDVAIVLPTKKATAQGDPVLCYLGEGQQLGYLPGKAAIALGWRNGSDDDDEDDVVETAGEGGAR